MGCTTVRIGGSSTVVKVAGGSAKRVTLDRRTVAKISDNRPRVVPVVSSTPVNVTRRDTVVRTGGAMGAQGPKGEPGGTVPPVAFAFGDAASMIFVPDATGTLTEVRVKMTVAFDDAAATIVLGTIAEPDAALPAEYCDPTTISEYEYTPDLRLAPGEGVRITISPGTSSAGAGIVFLTYLPD